MNQDTPSTTDPTTTTTSTAPPVLASGFNRRIGFLETLLTRNNSRSLAKLMLVSTNLDRHERGRVEALVGPYCVITYHNSKAAPKKQK